MLAAAVDPVSVSVKIGRPREEVFAYLADIANHPEFSDHYLEQFRLTRVDSVGRGGKFNRIRTTAIWTLDVAPGGGTEVEYMIESEPVFPTDRIVEALSGQRGWFKRKVRKAMRRLQAILEENEDRGARATVGGV